MAMVDQQRVRGSRLALRSNAVVKTVARDNPARPLALLAAAAAIAAFAAMHWEFLLQFR